MMHTSTSTSLKSSKSKSEKKQTQDHSEMDLFMPSDATIANILNYSSSLKVHASPSVGFIEIVAS